MFKIAYFHWLFTTVDTRQGYVALATHGRVALILEIVFTRAAPAFDNLFMGCVLNINTVHKTVEKLTFQAFYFILFLFILFY